MWRRPEGGINNKVLAEFLDALLFYLMRHPGISLKAMSRFYDVLYTPVDLQDMLEVRFDEEVDCVLGGWGGGGGGVSMIFMIVSS